MEWGLLWFHHVLFLPFLFAELAQLGPTLTLSLNRTQRCIDSDFDIHIQDIQDLLSAMVSVRICMIGIFCGMISYKLLYLPINKHSPKNKHIPKISIADI